MKFFGFTLRFRIAVLVFIFLLPFKLHSQQGKNNNNPQYLFPEFSECNVILKDGQVQTQVMNYNTVTEKMVYMEDGKYYDLLSYVLIDTIYLQNCKFIPYRNVFYEVLLSDKFPLFIQHRSNLVQAGKPVGYGQKSQGVTSYYLSKHELAPEYINIQIPPDVTVKADPAFWIRIEDEMFDFANKKQFIALFPEKENEIKDFIKKNRIKFDKPDEIINLVKYINSLE